MQEVYTWKEIAEHFCCGHSFEGSSWKKHNIRNEDIDF